MKAEQRIYGFDLIRLIAFQAIIIFHCSWAIWLNPSGPPDPLPTPIWRFMEVYARMFSFSGFVIVFMTSFLLGIKESDYRKKFWLPIFLLGGWLLFWFCTYLKEKDLFIFQWDIYPFLVVGWLSGRWILNCQRKLRVAFAILSVVLLCIPFWKIQSARQLPFWLGQILVGLCPEDYADWPILPWIALIWLGMLVGHFMRARKRVGQLFFAFYKVEYFIAGLMIPAFLSLRARYFVTRLGDGWSCFTFRQELWVFWTHMLFWMGLLRLSLHPVVQNTLAASKIVRMLSSLAINRHFFLAYLGHYLLIFALIGLWDPQQTADNKLFLDSIVLLVLPLSEIFARGTAGLFKRR